MPPVGLRALGLIDQSGIGIVGIQTDHTDLVALHIELPGKTGLLHLTACIGGAVFQLIRQREQGIVQLLLQIIAAENIVTEGGGQHIRVDELQDQLSQGFVLTQGLGQLEQHGLHILCPGLEGVAGTCHGAAQLRQVKGHAVLHHYIFFVDNCIDNIQIGLQQRAPLLARNLRQSQRTQVYVLTGEGLHCLGEIHGIIGILDLGQIKAQSSFVIRQQACEDGAAHQGELSVGQ